MPKSTPSSPFYWNDYYRDTRLLSVSARGVWMDMLCRVHESKTRGEITLTLDEWTRWCACGQVEFLSAVSEIKRHDLGTIHERSVPNSKTENSGSGKSNVEITVINRRMSREEEYRKNNNVRQETFREKRRSNGTVTPDITAYKRKSNTGSSSPSSSSEEFKNLPTLFRKGDSGDKSEGDRSGGPMTALSSTLQHIFKDKLILDPTVTLDQLKEEASDAPER